MSLKAEITIDDEGNIRVKYSDGEHVLCLGSVASNLTITDVERILYEFEELCKHEWHIVKK